MQPLAYPQGSHQPMGGMRPRVDYGAALMAGFQQDHETRRRNQHRPRNQHNAAASIPAAASHPEPDVDQFNAQFHQHIIDFQRAAEEQQQHQMEREQAEHQHRQNELLAQQQAHEAHFHFQAEQARLHLEAEQTQLRFEAEQCYQNQVAQQERLTQQRREYRQLQGEYEQQQHLEEMYEEHSQLSQEQHEEDEQRHHNQQQEHDDNDPPPSPSPPPPTPPPPSPPPPLIPNEGQDPSYAQLYIYDPEQATDHCTRRNPNLNRQTLADLHDMLFNFHPYVNLYKQAYQVMMDKPPEQHPDLHVQLHFSEGTDAQRYNLPTANEIAAIIPGDGSEAVNEHRDIVL
ncbi:hypothetical protein BU15DRAFT_79608 [Melanogaster broomeanus]|nr:hypothetical protein BU15DRAFT_79608 [Melanogaster broomeanus]